MDQLDQLWNEYKFGGNEEAREKLITDFVPIVNTIARRLEIYASSSYGFEDLVSVGLMGLLDAIEKFQPGKGAIFKTYAWHRIRGAILDEIRALDWVPRSIRDKASQLEKAYQTVRQRTGRAAEEFEVAEELGISQQQLQETLAEVGCTSILTIEDLMTDEENEEIVNDWLADPYAVDVQEQVELQENKEILAESIDQLPEKEKLVVSLYYNEEATMQEISLILGITVGRVSQLHSSAIVRLRNALKPPD
ncbi:FliA/WhiG family RNA polymerase sigma factor [Candidatus Poribacteria bacterium]|jgi:RNA polymerase sigma factor for flagellar operon FliA|nr:FliA/WhiG family RNA polymerase sigma factor [Candidatus Poribacteria bacterium]MCH2573994.1 FliA/WhiG family RNA polymerase sigma factor [Candidatus Poribacteria bacterium]|tara:strand:- start:74 stop:823 length:750 start_codon:yes stop_codon:yes gene_type:complete